LLTICIHHFIVIVHCCIVVVVNLLFLFMEPGWSLRLFYCCCYIPSTFVVVWHDWSLSPLPLQDVVERNLALWNFPISLFDVAGAFRFTLPIPDLLPILLFVVVDTVHLNWNGGTLLHFSFWIFVRSVRCSFWVRGWLFGFLHTLLHMFYPSLPAFTCVVLILLIWFGYHALPFTLVDLRCVYLHTLLWNLHVYPTPRLPAFVYPLPPFTTFDLPHRYTLRCWLRSRYAPRSAVLRRCYVCWVTFTYVVLPLRYVVDSIYCCWSIWLLLTILFYHLFRFVVLLGDCRYWCCYCHIVVVDDCWFYVTICYRYVVVRQLRSTFICSLFVTLAGCRSRLYVGFVRWFVDSRSAILRSLDSSIGIVDIFLVDLLLIRSLLFSWLRSYVLPICWFDSRCSIYPRSTVVLMLLFVLRSTFVTIFVTLFRYVVYVTFAFAVRCATVALLPLGWVWFVVRLLHFTLCSLPFRSALFCRFTLIWFRLYVHVAVTFGYLFVRSSVGSSVVLVPVLPIGFAFSFLTFVRSFRSRFVR